VQTSSSSGSKPTEQAALLTQALRSLVFECRTIAAAKGWHGLHWTFVRCSKRGTKQQTKAVALQSVRTTSAAAALQTAAHQSDVTSTLHCLLMHATSSALHSTLHIARAKQAYLRTMSAPHSCLCNDHEQTSLTYCSQ
jgi:hypothetical protein